MNNSTKSIITTISLMRCLLMVMSVVLVFLLCGQIAKAEDGKGKNVLCTTFPIYQITRNVIAGAKGVNVELMLPAAMGCPHDYELTPRDLMKLEKAEILVVNGLGMEEFLGMGGVVGHEHEGTAPDIKAVIIDSSHGITEAMSYTKMDSDDDHDEDHDEDHAEEHHEDHDGEEGHHHHHHHHHGMNPHLFASPALVAKIAVNIASGLAKEDSENAAVYMKNAAAYAAEMNALAQQFRDLGQALSNNRIVTQHGVFDYLAKDIGLEIVAVVQAHAGEEPSTAEMIRIVKTIREKKAGAMFTEPQYPARIGQTIAKEAKISCASLDPVASGPDNAPVDYYTTVMKQNLLTLGKVLGTK